MDFTDKRVLVTGSSRGIGFDIAKTFLEAGARVAINGSTEQSASAAMEKIGDFFGRGGKRKSRRSVKRGRKRKSRRSVKRGGKRKSQRSVKRKNKSRKNKSRKS